MSSTRTEDLSTLRTFLTEVSAVEDLSPHLRQVTFRGPDLETFAPVGPDTFLYLLVPPPGQSELAIDQSFSWEEYFQMDEAIRPVGAYYTLRHWRPEQAELDIHMVLHGDSGPASAWAGRAAVGDVAALWGPRTAYHPPEGTEHLLLVADETGLPAVAVILEQLPAGITAHVVAETSSVADQPPLPTGPGMTVQWLYRDGIEPGRSTALVEAVTALRDFDRPTYVWGGGESRSLTAVRRHVRQERGLAREQVSLVAYWRHADSPVEIDDD